MMPWSWLKAATAACSCLSVTQTVATIHPAESVGEMSFAEFAKIAGTSRNAGDFLLTAHARTVGHAVDGPIVTPPSYRPADPRRGVLASTTSIDEVIGLNITVRTSETSYPPAPPVHDTLSMEGWSKPAFEPVAARQADNPSGTARAALERGSDAIYDAVTIAPAACPACRPSAPTFNLRSRAQADGDAQDDPATMPNAEGRDEPATTEILSVVQRPIETVAGGSGPRSMDEPDLPLLSSGAQVRSLRQALSNTYQTNPTLMARRAELRGLDNLVALEQSAGNPQIFAGSTFTQDLHTTRALGARGRNLRSTVDFSKIVFAGGRIRNATRAARTRVIAGRAELRATEGDILTDAVAAYADVLRDREIRELNQSQVRILAMNLESTRDRFGVRDLTLTDVAQSETRLEVAKSNLATSEGRLQASEENFERIVGARAGDLEPLPALPPLPLSSELAVQTALADNADIVAFAARARAADYDVAVSRAARLPTLSVVGTVDNDNALGTANSASGLPSGTTPNSETNIAAGLTVRIPLFQGGAASARTRLNEEIRSQYIEEAIAVERLVVADTRTAFSIWRSATSAISANESAVTSSGKALESVKFEQTVGAHSILDVLNAEQEFLNSKIALTSARRDAYVAAFELLNSMGASEAADLDFAADPLYDPRVNYKKYSDSWWDWKDIPRRPPASTRNVPAEAESPLTRLNSGTLHEIEPDD